MTTHQRPPNPNFTILTTSDNFERLNILKIDKKYKKARLFYPFTSRERRAQKAPTH